MELTPSLLLTWLLVLVVGTARVLELRVSRRRQRVLATRGVKRVAEPHFAAMVALHTTILLGSALEPWLAGRPPIPIVSAAALAVLAGATALRLWVIATLGPHWNVQVMDSLSLGVVSAGPFRWIRHPNYLAVFLELAALPLVHSAWWTAILGTAAHVWVLYHRIRTEEAALLAHPDYRRQMGRKPRFLPAFRRDDAAASRGQLS
jgi:methyltransferase